MVKKRIILSLLIALALGLAVFLASEFPGHKPCVNRTDQNGATIYCG